MPKQKMIDLLYELIRNSKRSDRELAKAVSVSQPTITRMRKSLEKSELIHEYTVIPCVEKLGFEIMALNFMSADSQEKNVKIILEQMSQNPNVLFVSSGGGLGGKTHLLISIHKGFTDFSEFIRELRGSTDSTSVMLESFLVSLKTDVIKHFSFQNLGKM